MPKKQHYSSAPLAVNDCRELLLWMIPHLDKLPRTRRYTLGEKLESRVLTVLESLVTAAYAPNKSTFLFQANRDLEVCRHLWRLCYDVKGISAKSYEHGSKLIYELGKQIGGWMKVKR